MSEMFNVWVHVTSDKGESEELKGKITFEYNPDQYGNGHYMGVKGLGEPRGEQGYDIRYDKSFDPEKKLLYIAEFFANRYDGKEHKGEYGKRWSLLGIRVHEAEEL